MNLYKQVNEWLLNYEPLNSWLYFNATPVILGTAALNSVPGDRVTKEFVDGSKEKQLIFAIDMITSYDADGTSDVNMDALDEVNHFSDWIEQQYTDDNFPDFGETNTITKIEVLTNVPSLLVDATSQLAKYQFQSRITYKDESEVVKNG